MLSCDTCNKKIGGENGFDNLLKHKRIVHKIGGDYLCEVCGLSFEKLSSLRRHNTGAHKRKRKASEMAAGAAGVMTADETASGTAAEFQPVVERGECKLTL